MSDDDKLSCGNCGQATFEVSGRETLHGGYSEVNVKCCYCGSSTILVTTTPAIETRWGDNSAGILCHLSHTGHRLKNKE